MITHLFKTETSRAKSIFYKTLNFHICELIPKATLSQKSYILDLVLLMSKEISHIWYTHS